MNRCRYCPADTDLRDDDGPACKQHGGRPMVFRIYCKTTSCWTGHLHTTTTEEAAERWAQCYRDQGYGNVYIVAATH